MPTSRELHRFLVALILLHAACSHGLRAADAAAPATIAVIYYSETGNTKVMAETIVAGIKRVDGIDAKTFPLDAIDVDYVKGSKCVIFGTPTQTADMAPAVKKWFVEATKPYDLAGKIGGVFATANYHHGGAELAMQGIMVQMLVKGMLVHSGGGAYGTPIIHLGPAAFGGRLEESEDLFLIYGERMAQKTAELFK